MRSYITQEMLELEIEAEILSIPDEEVREPPALDGWDYLLAWLFAVELPE